MSLRLIIGRAGTGKTRCCLQEIRQELLDNPKGGPLFYIIPEQATFQAEYALATLPGIKGTMRAQAVSFRRLAFKVAQEMGGGRGLYIDDGGKSMLLRKIMERQSSHLKVFTFKNEHAGVVEKLVALYNELKRSRVSPADFGRFLADEGSKGNAHQFYLREKIRDLTLIYNQMSQEMAGGYLDAEDYLDLLIEKIPTSQALQEAVVWVDAFTTFNNQEKAVLTALLKHCHGVTVTLCLDQDQPVSGLPSELDPFYPAALACRHLKQAAAVLKVPCRVDLLPQESPRRFPAGSPIAHMEKEFHSQPPRPYPLASVLGADSGRIRLVSAAHRRCEVEAIAREVMALARDGGCRWRDIVVLAGSLEDYQDTLSTVFRDYGIPFFMDEKRPLLHHPLAEFIRSALEVVQKNWRWDAVFRCAKTDLLVPVSAAEEEREVWRERVNRLENYVLAFGISGSRWLQAESWDYHHQDDLDEPGEHGGYSWQEELYIEEINATRDQIRRPLAAFQERMRGAATVQEKTAALFELLQGVEAPGHLESWREDALARGDMDKVREHFQVYKLVLDLMDQLVEIMGEEKVSAALFARVLESGLEGLRLSLVPPALDQVLVGTPDRTQPGSVKFAFILGVTDGGFPARLQEDTILSDEEREALTALGIELTPLREKQLQEEQFLMYKTLTLPSRQLWVSYPLADAEGKGLMPSLLVSRLKALFPDLQEQSLTSDPAPGMTGDEILAYTAHPHRTLSHLSVQLGIFRKKAAMGAIDPLWWDIYNWYAAREEWRERGTGLLKGVFYTNQENFLARGTCKRLYGDRLKLSVSRLEKYRSCPFSHFISHGLRLKERQVYRLDSPQIGRFFHTALYRLAKSMQVRGLDFSDLTIQETLSLAHQEVDEIIPILHKEILLSSNRYRFLGSRLKDTVGRAALVLREQALKSRFKPVGLELAFGGKEGLSTLKFTLEDGTEVQLVGRIDRLDGALGEDQRYYLRVVDYKSGKTPLDIKEVYYGLSLQIMTYLEVALRSAPNWLGKDALPAGILYFRIHSPVLREKNPISRQEAEAKILREYRMEGRVLRSMEVVRLMDTGLTQGTSAIIPVGIKAGGEFRKNSHVVDAEDFAGLRCHVQKTIQESACSMMTGDIRINPYKLGKKKACRFCSYKAVCQFDPLVQGNLFHILPALAEEEVFACLRESLAKEDDGRGGGL
jgi:ATP-dependent helicase/nuclease subunit B